MGKVTKFTLVKKDSQLLELKTGPISILMGRNLRKPLDNPSANSSNRRNKGEG